jgi:hypothetical protein
MPVYLICEECRHKFSLAARAPLQDPFCRLDSTGWSRGTPSLPESRLADTGLDDVSGGTKCAACWHSPASADTMPLLWLTA